MDQQPLPETPATSSLVQFTASSGWKVAADYLASLPNRLDNTMLTTVESIATESLPALPPCDEQHLTQCLAILDASLPRQATNGVNGKLRLKAYQRKLSHLPAGSISHLADQALERCRWFPTIAECLEIAAEWRRDDDAVQAKAKAQAMARRERETRMDEAMSALQRGELDDDAVNGWGDWWKQIAQTRGLITIDGEGHCRIRESAIWRPAPEIEPEEVLAGIAEQFPSNREDQAA